MNVYDLRSELDGYLDLDFVEDDFDVFDAIRVGTGASVLAEWPLIRVQLCQESDPTHESPSDCPKLWGAICPILSSLAVELLRVEFEKYGELLPLIGEDQTYYAWNVLAESDAIDFDESKLWIGDVVESATISVPRPIDIKQLVWIREYAFHEDRVKRGAFRLALPPECPPSHQVFVTDEFKELLCNPRLVGFDLRLIWSSKP